MKPKVLIGTPTYEGKEYCLDYWMKRLELIVRNSKRDFKVDVLIVDNSSDKSYMKLLSKYGFETVHIPRVKNPLESIANAQEVLFKRVLDGRYDFLFSLEQDVVPPADILGTLFKLRNRTKSPKTVIGAPYVLTELLRLKKGTTKRKEYLTSVADKVYFHKKFGSYIQQLMFASQMPKKEIMRAYAVGMGCTLIDAGVIKQIPVEFHKRVHKPSDAYFYLNCKEKGIPVYSANNLLTKVRHFRGSSLSEESWQQSSLDKK